MNQFMKRYINILLEGMCFGVVFIIFTIAKDKLNLNISEKELIIWALVLWVAVSIIIRTIMEKIDNKKVDNREHTNMN